MIPEQVGSLYLSVLVPRGARLCQLSSAGSLWWLISTIDRVFFLTKKDSVFQLIGISLMR